MNKRFDQTTPTYPVLDAISKLKSWLRYRDGSFWRGAGIGRAIYFYKNTALEKLMGAGLINARLVEVQVKCRDCNGSGRYTDWDGYKYPHCRACSSTGVACLRFYETDLPDGFTWHTPIHKAPFGMSRLVGDGLPELPAGDWTVNRPGQPLTPDEVAACLNLVEDWYFGGNFPEVYEIKWNYDTYNNANWYYKLFIGQREFCAYCRSEVVEAMHYGKSTNIVEWLDSLCDECASNLDWERFALPDEIVTENIRVWMNRRARWYHVKEKYNPENEPIPF